MSLALVPVAAASSSAGAAFSASSAGSGAAAGGVAAASLAVPLTAGASLAGALGYSCCRKRRRTEGNGDSGGAVSLESGLDRVTSLEARLARAEERLGRIEDSSQIRAGRWEAAEAERRRGEAAAREAFEKEMGRVSLVLEQKATVDLVEKRLEGLKDQIKRTIDEDLASVWCRLGEKAHKQDVEGIEGQVCTLRGTLVEKADKAEAQLVEIERLDERISTLRDCLHNKADKVQAQQTRDLMELLQQNLDSLRLKMQEKASSADAERLEEQLGDLKAELRQQMGKVDSVDQRLGSLSEQLGDQGREAQCQIEGLEHKLASLRDSVSVGLAATGQELEFLTPYVTARMWSWGGGAQAEAQKASCGRCLKCDMVFGEGAAHELKGACSQCEGELEIVEDPTSATSATAAAVPTVVVEA